MSCTWLWPLGAFTPGTTTQTLRVEPGTGWLQPPGDSNICRVPKTTPPKRPVWRGPEGRVSPRVRGQSTTLATRVCWATSSQTPEVAL